MESGIPRRLCNTTSVAIANERVVLSAALLLGASIERADREGEILTE